MGLNIKKILARLFNPLRGRRIVLMSPNKVVVNIGTDAAFVRKLLKNPTAFEVIIKSIASNPEALHRLLTHSETRPRIGAQAAFLGSLIANRAVMHRMVRSEAFAARVVEPTEKGEEPAIGTLLRRPAVFEVVADFFASNPEALSRLLTRTRNVDGLASQASFITMLADNRAVIQRLARSDAFAAQVAAPGRKGEEPAIAAFLRRPVVFDRITDFFATNPEALARLLAKTRNLSALAAQGSFVESLAGHPRVVGRLLTSPALATGLSGAGGERTMRFFLNRADIGELLATAMKEPAVGADELAAAADETDVEIERDATAEGNPDADAAGTANDRLDDEVDDTAREESEEEFAERSAASA
jgi:hypothetical protein